MSKNSTKETRKRTIPADKADSLPKQKKKRAEKHEQDIAGLSAGMLQNLEPKWELARVLSQSFQTSEDCCRNFVKMVEAECTLPFIARYRREAVGNAQIETLQQMKATLSELVQVKKKIGSVLKTLDAQKQLTPDIQEAIKSSTTIEEVEHWYAPFKVSGKKTNLVKAKDLGLEEIALKILNGNETVGSLRNYVQQGKEGLENENEIKGWIKIIIADSMTKNEESIGMIRDLVQRRDATICCTKSRSAGKQQEDKVLKFQDYFEFSRSVKAVKPHQMLAINRGEDLKILSVKVQVPSYFQYWRNFCSKKYFSSDTQYPLRREIITESISYAYEKTVETTIVRKIRAALNEEATRASIEVFSANLRQMLLIPPLRGAAVLGMDPGFKNGCKCALVAADGTFVKSAVVYPKFGSKTPDEAAVTLRNILAEFGCTVIALGNGTACRETESYVSRLIQSGYFRPLDVLYTIVNESGASIYSCTPEARQDYPNLDPNIISAVSIAKRLQDPLAELVRVSARHLGIGMYQHDISAAKLDGVLDDVVVECVSFVGVDLNTCPLHLLSQVAGIGPVRAKNIIEWRSSKGPFICREQLLEVKSIGPKTFEQCAGFLKILPFTSSATSKTSKAKTGKKYSPNPLDRTCVHPESYETASQIVRLCQGRMEDIGSAAFLSTLESYLKTTTLEQVSAALNVSFGKVQQIVESLLQPIEHDYRQQFEKPLFRRGLTSLDDLRVGTELTGKVMNVTHFGAFVDVGVGVDALLHVSQMKNRNKEISVGSRVKVHVSNIDKKRQRLGVSLV